MTADGERSISAQRDMIGNIMTTGNNSPVFIGEYERLNEAYINPRSVFERVMLERFVGREWLEDIVNSFLRNNDHGYLILEAPAGSGKTTFICHLVKERRYIHHFVELAPGSDGIGPGLRSLAAQLVALWGLKPQLLEEVLPSAASRPDYLQNILFEVAERRDQLNPQEKIVITVDALDEAGSLTGMNVMGLPKVLPKGVYIIVTQRPIRVALYAESPKIPFKFGVEDERNLSDMKVYLKAAAAREPVLSLLKSSGYAAEKFVEELLHKSAGVWIYLHYVINEIERGERLPLNLDTLPQGIWQYYAQFWQRQRDTNGSEWDASFLPILSTLAAVQEDISFEILCKLSGLEERESLKRILRETWRPFIAGLDEGQRYRFYHASLREFFDGRANINALTAQEQALSLELTEATKRAHQRIADHYLTEWGGLDSKLPSLGKSVTLAEDETYGRRHIVAHLEKAGRVSEIHKLLSLERQRQNQESSDGQSLASAIRQRWLTDDERIELQIPARPENIWYEARETEVNTSGYLSDLTRAWKLATESTSPDVESVELTPSIGLELRYALMSASLHSLAGTIPPELIAAAVKKGVWHSLQGLVISRQITDVRRRAEALTGLIPHLSLQTKANVWSEAIYAVRSIPYKDDPHIHDEETRLRLFIDLSQTEEDVEKKGHVLHEALEYIRKVRNEETRARLINHIIPHISDSIVEDVFSTVKDFINQQVQMNVLSNIIPLLSSSLSQEAIVMIFKVKDPSLRALMLNKVAHQVNANGKSEVISEALKSATLIEDTGGKVKALGRLLVHLDSKSKHRLVDEIRAMAHSIQDEDSKSRVVSELPHILCNHVSDETLKQIVGEALVAARGEGSAERAIELERLISFVPDDQKRSLHDEVMNIARTAPYKFSREGLLRTISYHAQDNKKQAVIREALELAFADTDDQWRDYNIAYFLLSLDDPFLEEVMIDWLSSRQITANNRPGLVEVPVKWKVTDKIVSKALIGALEREWYGTGGTSFSKFLSHIPAHIRENILRLSLLETLSSLHSDMRGWILRNIMTYLSEETIREALRAVQIIGDEYEIGSALTLLQHFIPEGSSDELFDSVIEQARILRFRERSIDLLLPLFAHLDATRKERVLAESLSLARSIKDTDKRAHALTRLVSIVPQDRKEQTAVEALNAVRMINNESSRLSNLKSLIPHLTGDEKDFALQQALSLSRNIVEVEQRTSALKNMLSHLPPPLKASVLDEALKAARAVDGGGKKARALSWLITEISGDVKAKVLEEATEAALNAEDDADRSWALRALVKHLPQESLININEKAKTIKQALPRAELLLALLKCLPEERGAEIRADIIKVLREAISEDDKTTILILLINESLDFPSIESLLLDVRALPSPKKRAYAISAFIRQAPSEAKIPLLRETVEAIKQISEEEERAHTMLFFVPILVKELSEFEAPEVTYKKFNEERHTLLREVASLFQDNLPILARKTRYEILREMHFIAPAISALGSQNAIIEIVSAIRNVGHWWP